MSRYHCSCRFAADDADEFGDRIRLAFARDDDIGADGQLHADLAGGNGRTPGSPRHACACGFASDDTPEFPAAGSGISRESCSNPDGWGG